MNFDHFVKEITNTMLYTYEYQYDAIGNRTQMVNFTGAQTITTNYTYNNLNQLTQRVVNSGPDQGTWTYGYDNNWNMTLEKKGAAEKRYFNYNFDDRMTHVEVNYADIYDYEYDALGRRLIATDNNNNKTLYYYDGIRVILEKTKPAGGSNWQTSRTYLLDGSNLGFIICCIDDGCKKFYHYDKIGNVMDITNENGEIISSYEQDSFGNVLIGDINDFHLTTKEYYNNIRLYYFFKRWYEPIIGRFTQMDPIVSSINLYVYCNNNPVNIADPSGLWWWTDHCKLTYEKCKKLELPEKLCRCVAKTCKLVDLPLYPHPEGRTVQECMDKYCNNAIGLCLTNEMGKCLHCVQDVYAHHCGCPTGESDCQKEHPDCWENAARKTEDLWKQWKENCGCQGGGSGGGGGGGNGGCGGIF